MSANISIIPAEMIPQIEGALRPLVARLKDHLYGRFDEDTLIEALKAHKMDLWIAFDDDHHVLSFVATEIYTYPLKKVLSCAYCGGFESELWADDMMYTLMDHARDNGCSAIQVGGRAGWVRSLKRYGFNFLCTTVEREL